MGAAKENRDKKHFRDSLYQQNDVHYSCRQIEAQLQQDLDKAKVDKSDLARSLALIERLRAENQVLRDEKRKFMEVVEMCKRHISVAGNCHKKYGVALVKSQLQKARLI